MTLLARLMLFGGLGALIMSSTVACVLPPGEEPIAADPPLVFHNTQEPRGPITRVNPNCVSQNVSIRVTDPDSSYIAFRWVANNNLTNWSLIDDGSLVVDRSLKAQRINAVVLLDRFDPRNASLGVVSLFVTDQADRIDGVILPRWEHPEPADLPPGVPVDLGQLDETASAPDNVIEARWIFEFTDIASCGGSQ